jgi:hypothetical protein
MGEYCGFDCRCEAAAARDGEVLMVSAPFVLLPVLVSLVEFCCPMLQGVVAEKMGVQMLGQSGDECRGV